MKCLILAFFIIATIWACNDAESPLRTRAAVPEKDTVVLHACAYTTCPYKGQEKFSRSIAEFPQHEESCAIDSVHFLYPEKDYDFIDSLLFTPKAQPNVQTN